MTIHDRVLCHCSQQGRRPLHCRNAGSDGVSLHWGELSEMITQSGKHSDTFTPQPWQCTGAAESRGQQKSNSCYKIPQTDHAPFHQEWHTFNSHLRGSVGTGENALSFVWSQIFNRLSIVTCFSKDNSSLNIFCHDMKALETIITVGSERWRVSGIGPQHPSPFQYLQHKERSDPRIGIIWTVFTGAPSQKYIDYLCTPLPPRLVGVTPRSLSYIWITS